MSVSVRRYRAGRGGNVSGLVRRGLLALVAVVVAAAAACGPPQRRLAPVVLIAIDTLRADHMSLYGYGRDTTPRIDQLARSGSVFEHAFSAAAWTLPAMASLLTGQWPSVHGAGLGEADRFNRPDTEIPTLAELLQAAGYVTGAVVNAGYLHPEFGFARGFESYDFERGAEDQIRRADASVDIALE